MDELLKQEIIKAKECLANSGVICFPTETVMGLGIYFDDYNAYNRLNEIKNRREDKPYTLMVKDVKEIDKYAYVNEKVSRVIDAFMPGSLTILLKAKDNVPSYVTHNSGIIGIRIPSNEEAINLLKSIDKPLLVPSANKSGDKPALNSKEAKEIFADEIGAYINGVSKGEVASTIIDFSKDEPILIRKGPIEFNFINNVYLGHKFEETVMIYLERNDEILMIYRNKKKVDINKNKYIGVGGHVEKGESKEEAVVREVKEETSLKLLSYIYRGKVIFHFDDDIELMHVYTSKDYSGEIDYNCNEGDLVWKKISDLPSINMWEGDHYFLDIIYKTNHYFEMEMRYDNNGSLIDYRLIKES